MKYFVRSKAVTCPGKYFEATDKKAAFEMVQKEMLAFVQKASEDDLVIDVTDFVKDIQEKN